MRPTQRSSSGKASDWDPDGPGAEGGPGLGQELGHGRGRLPTPLTLLSAARITRQQASTGPTPLSDREPVVRPLELSAHKLWLGEMPGSWAEKPTPWRVRGDAGRPLPDSGGTDPEQAPPLRSLDKGTNRRAPAHAHGAPPLPEVITFHDLPASPWLSQRPQTPPELLTSNRNTAVPLCCLGLGTACSPGRGPWPPWPSGNKWLQCSTQPPPGPKGAQIGVSAAATTCQPPAKGPARWFLPFLRGSMPEQRLWPLTTVGAAGQREPRAGFSFFPVLLQGPARNVSPTEGSSLAGPVSAPPALGRPCGRRRARMLAGLSGGPTSACGAACSRGPPCLDTRGHSGTLGGGCAKRRAGPQGSKLSTCPQGLPGHCPLAEADLGAWRAGSRAQLGTPSSPQTLPRTKARAAPAKDPRARLARRTCLQHHQVRGVIPHVGHGGDVMDGHPEDGVLPVPPGQLDVVGRQADDRVMLLGQVSGELVGSLRGTRGHQKPRARPRAPLAPAVHTAEEPGTLPSGQPSSALRHGRGGAGGGGRGPACGLDISKM